MTGTQTPSRCRGTLSGKGLHGDRRHGVPARDFVSFGLGTRGSRYAVGGVAVPDFHGVGAEGLLSFLGAGKRSSIPSWFGRDLFVTGRSADDPFGAGSRVEGGGEPTPFTLFPGGRFTLGEGRSARLGAFEPEGGAGFLIDPISPRADLDFLGEILLRRSISPEPSGK